MGFFFNRLYPTGTRSRRNSSEAKVEDLDAWLHADVELDAAQSDNGTIVLVLVSLYPTVFDVANAVSIVFRF